MNDIIQFLLEYGYFALYLSIWLGIPNELLVLTGGFVTALGYFSFHQAWMVMYAGVISYMTLWYFLGRFIGSPLMKRMERSKFGRQRIKKADELISKYGSAALVISFFLPLARQIVPLLVGVRKLPFYKLVGLTYITGIAWTLIYFSMGYHFYYSVFPFFEGFNFSFLWLLIIPGALIYVLIKKRGSLANSTQGQKEK
jgi:membrane protein DedA with SNARE-associated domain